MSRGPSISFHDPRPASLNFPAIRDLSTADPAAWPVDARYRPKTVGERLAPTLKVAREKRDEAAARAKRTGVTLNVAIGGQVVLGALTTAVSAATIGNGRSTSIATSVLGGVATLIASYLARMRGSSEPESSIRLTMDLDQFLRDIEAFVLDHGHETGYPPAHTFSTPSSPLPGAFPPLNGTPSEKLTDDTDELRGKWDERVAAFRRRLDQLLAQGGAAGGGENRAVV